MHTSKWTQCIHEYVQPFRHPLQLSSAIHTTPSWCNSVQDPLLKHDPVFKSPFTMKPQFFVQSLKMVLKYGHFYSRSSNFALILVLMLKNFTKFQLHRPPFHDKISSKDNTFTTKSGPKPLHSEIRVAHLYRGGGGRGKNIQCLLQGQPVFNRF